MLFFTSLPLTVQEREAIIEFHNVSWRNKDRGFLEAEHVEALFKLELDCDKLIKEKFGPSGKASLHIINWGLLMTKLLNNRSIH